jgi:protein involved in polysaccharide export with SLBB domain
MLMNAIAQVGGVRREAKQSDVRIYRKMPGSDQTAAPIKVDFSAIKKRLAPDIELQAYDIVEVGESLLNKSMLLQTLIGGVRSSVGIATGLPVGAMQTQIVR